MADQHTEDARCDYRNHYHMEALAHRMQHGHASRRPIMLAAAITDQHLVLLRPWYMRWIAHLVKLRHGTTFRFWFATARVIPGSVQQMIEDTADHIRNGKCMWTPDAAGGLSQTEVGKLLRILRNLESYDG